MKRVTKPLFLIAEENQKDRLLIKKAFEECGCCAGLDFTFVNAREELINYLQRLYVRSKDGSNSKPSLLILDLNLARKGEYEVIREIKTHPALNSIPIVVLASSLNGEVIEHLYQMGVNTFFIKPPIFSELLDVVSNIYNRARV